MPLTNFMKLNKKEKKCQKTLKPEIEKQSLGLTVKQEFIWKDN